MDEEFTTVATYLNLADADVARSLLESEGIETFILDENTGNILPGLLAASTGGIRLQVRAENAERATELITDFNQRTETGESEAQE